MNYIELVAIESELVSRFLCGDADTAAAEHREAAKSSDLSIIHEAPDGSGADSDGVYITLVNGDFVGHMMDTAENRAILQAWIDAMKD